MYNDRYPEGDAWRLFDLHPRWRIYDETGLVEEYEPHYWFCDRPSYEDPGALSFDECEGPINSDKILQILLIWDPDDGRWYVRHVGFMGDDRYPLPPLANGRVYRMFYISVDSQGNSPWFPASLPAGYRSIRSRQIQTAYTVLIRATSGADLQDVTIPCNTPFNPLADVVAISSCEGDITPRITLTNGGLDVTKPGSYRLRYDAVDSYGWFGWAQRNVNVVDGERPVITLLDEAEKPMLDETGAPATIATTYIPWCALRDNGVEWWRESPELDPESDWYVLRPGDGWSVEDNCAENGMLTQQVQQFGQQELRDALEFLPAVRQQGITFAWPEGEAEGEGESGGIDPADYFRAYPISHNVNDGSGESTAQAVPAYRMVWVLPTMPQILLNINPNTTIECGAEFADLEDLVIVEDYPTLPPIAEGEVGNYAPPLNVSEWVKGGPHTLGDGKFYLVEFFATWCPYCRQAIPGLTQLQDA